ncbi:hypothetical protein C8F01DRAFT_1262545 [Mycena amicta]|nr:hypothetical protein C8F01DRAFT_1262545 [Mycena amicta]
MTPHFDLVNDVLEEILPPLTIFRSFLESTKDAVRKARELAEQSSLFSRSVLSAAWENLFSLQDSFSMQLVEYCDRDTVLKACDNMKCQRVAVREHFKCCSGCKIMNYCGRECQQHDWKAGGHREKCASYSLYRFSTSHLRLNETLVDSPTDLDSAYSAKERSFSRYVVHRAYLAGKAGVPPMIEQCRTVLASRGAGTIPAPGEIIFHCEFQLQPHFQPFPADRFPLPPFIPEVVAADMLQRVKASDGRMALYYLQIPHHDQDMGGLMLCRLRSTSRLLQAGGSPSGGEEILV